MAPTIPTNTHTHIFQTEVINSRAFDFHVQNPKTDMFLPWSTVYAASMWCGCMTSSGRLRKKEGRVLSLMNFQCVEDDLLEHLKDL